MATRFAKILTGSTLTTDSGYVYDFKGVNSVGITVDRGMVEDFDIDDDLPFHYQGNRKMQVTFESKDLLLFDALVKNPCVSSLSLKLAKPKGACAASADAAAEAATLAATHLALTGALSLSTDNSGSPGTFSVELTVSHDTDGTKGTFTITPASSGGGGGV